MKPVAGARGPLVLEWKWAVAALQAQIAAARFPLALGDNGRTERNERTGDGEPPPARCAIPGGTAGRNSGRGGVAMGKGGRQAGQNGEPGGPIRRTRAGGPHLLKELGLREVHARPRRIAA